VENPDLRKKRVKNLDLRCKISMPTVFNLSCHIPFSKKIRKKYYARDLKLRKGG